MNKEALLSFFAATLMRALARTLRVELHDKAGFFAPERSGSYIAAAWHNRILVLPVVFERWRTKRQRTLTVLTSASRDGGLLAAVVQRFGIDAVRGSTSRRGAAALLALAGIIENDGDIIITPDGPRGPRYTLSPGIIFLAQKTGIPVMRVYVEYSRYWELKSWDRFRIPKPFSKAVVTLSPVETVAPATNDEAFEDARVRLEKLLNGEEVLRSMSVG